jgi:hypothetical protein
MNRAGQLSEVEAIAAVAALVEEYRDVCFWFIRQDYRPVTATEALRALDILERYGDRHVFQRAEELKRWLSPHSNVMC